LRNNCRLHVAVVLVQLKIRNPQSAIRNDHKSEIDNPNSEIVNVMTKEELKIRTKQFALKIILLVEDIPNTKAGRTIGNQIIRSGTSVAANYRSACRARSNADFISKITLVEEESDETLFWLELIDEASLLKKEDLTDMLKEADELTAIFTASGKTARQNQSKKK
jgi:four helix bundle protein